MIDSVQMYFADQKALTYVLTLFSFVLSRSTFSSEHQTVERMELDCSIRFKNCFLIAWSADL
jgi:hypothetical protein